MDEGVWSSRVGAKRVMLDQPAIASYLAKQRVMGAGPFVVTSPSPVLEALKNSFNAFYIDRTRRCAGGARCEIVVSFSWG